MPEGEKYSYGNFFFKIYSEGFIILHSGESILCSDLLAQSMKNFVKEWVSCYTFGWEKDIAEGRRLSSYFPLYLFLLSIPLAIIQWLRKTAPGIQKSLMKPAFEWLQ